MHDGSHKFNSPEIIDTMKYGYFLNQMRASKVKMMAGIGENGINLKKILVSWLSFHAAYRIFGLVLIIMGLSFYIGWSILYDTWTDPGLYSVTVILVVFGILTLLLASEKDRLAGKSA